MTATTKIIIKELKENIIVGCYEYEKQQPQPIIMDLMIELYQNDWVNNDDLSQTLDYDELILFAKTILIKKTYNLLEGLIQYIAQQFLIRYTQIKSIQVDLVKVALSSKEIAEIKVSHYTVREFKIALALGSNHSYLPQQQLITAIELLGEYVTNIKIGNFYQTKPYGTVPQNDFVNTAIIGVTTLQPQQLITKIKQIEKLMGKTEIVINGPRIIDIDIILFDNLTYTNNFLTIPHKDMQNRDFVLLPLIDIAGNWIHPVFNKTINELCADLSVTKDTNIIKTLEYYKN